MTAAVVLAEHNSLWSSCSMRIKSPSYRGGDLLTQRGWETTDNEQGRLDSNPGPRSAC